MTKRFHLGFSVLLLSLLLSMMTLTGCTASESKTTPAPVSSPAGAPQEGIKVHGHWIIEVRNPDGTPAEYREFDNAFNTSVGADLLVKILSRQNSVGAWRVHLGSSGTDFPFLDGSTPAAGWLLESGDTATTLLSLTGNNVFRPLILTAREDHTLELRGTATAHRDGSIRSVWTWLSRAPATEPPSATYTGSLAGNFASTTLSSPVNLTAGQQVVVSVVISFS